MAASTSDCPTAPTSIRKVRSIVTMLPAMVPSSSVAVDSPARMGRPPSAARAPRSRPEAAVASVIAIIRDGCFAAIAVRTIAGWTCAPSQMSSAATSSVCSTATC